MRLSILALVIAMFAVGCGGGSADGDASADGNVDAAGDEDLVALAQECDSVTWYAAHDPEFVERAAGAFEEEYGISVDWIEAGSSEVASRIISEAQAGSTEADVVTAPSPNIAALVDQDLIQPYHSAHFDRIDEKVIDSLGEYSEFTTPSHTYLLGIAYNTNEVSQDEAPQSWEELSDADWDGRLVAPDPRYGFTYAAAVQFIVDQYGWEYFDAIGSSLRMARGGGDTLALLVTGEREAQLYSVFQIPAVAKARDDAPVEIVAPEEGALLFTTASSLIDGSPCPNGGKLLIDFITDREMQELTTEYNYYSAWPDVAAPDGVPGLDEVNWVAAPWLTVADPDAYEELVSRFEQAIGG